MRTPLICVYDRTRVLTGVGTEDQGKGEGGVNVRVKDTYPSAVCRVVVHGDIGPTILASIPLYLTMGETCIPKKNTDVTRKKGVKGERKRKRRGKGFALIRMPGKVKSLFGPRPILTIGLVFTKSIRRRALLHGYRQPKNGRSIGWTSLL